MNSVTRTTDTAAKPAASRSRRARVAGLVAVAAVAISACNSEPSAHRVAEDLINTLATSEAQRECMLEILDGYSKDEIADIEKSADESGPGTAIEMFEAELASCN